MNQRIIIFFVSLLLFTRLDAQTLIPGEGIEGDGIVINVSTIEDVVSAKGKADTIYNSGSRTYYGYTQSGISYGYDYYDQGRIIRSVMVQSPFSGCTSAGVCIGTKWRALSTLLGSSGGSSPSRDEVYRRENGICYYMRKKMIDRVVWDNEEPVYKITLDNYDRSGSEKSPGFRYDSISEQQGLMQFEKFIVSSRSLKTFRDSFPTNAGRKVKSPYRVRAGSGRERILEFDQTESRMDIYCGLTRYELTFFSLHDTIYYAGIIPASRMNDTAQVFFSDTVIVNRLFQRMQKEYGPAADSLRSQMHSPYSFVYSPYGCGELSYKNKMCRNGDELIDRQDTSQLVQWLCSGIPEQQAYALYGLWELHSNGLRLSDNIFSLMEHVARLDVSVYTCNGCVTYQVMHFSDIVSPRLVRQAKRNN